MEEALQWYDAAWRMSVYDLVFLAPSHFRQGQIQERLGQRAEALRHYKRFVELWQDCDPELHPLVAEARAALKRLGGEPRQ